MVKPDKELSSQPNNEKSMNHEYFVTLCLWQMTIEVAEWKYDEGLHVEM